MNTKLTSKLCLGTVQFGLDYGIASRKKSIDKKSAFEILKHACNVGINTLDTAYSYGESEEIIGEFTKISGNCLNIVSKLPRSNIFDDKDIDQLFYTSLKRLRTNKIYGYLIHNFDDFLESTSVWNALKRLKKKGVVENIGFSLYSPQELEVLFDKKVNFDIIQIPYSVFDRRFETYFKRLKTDNVKIYVRSVFLQGLAFLDSRTIPENLIKARDYMEALRSIALMNNISVNGLCLSFPLLNSWIDKVVIGVDNLTQLKRNLVDIDIDKVRSIYAGLNDLIMEREDILLPYRWAKK